jgi:hypothetical protein
MLSARQRHINRNTIVKFNRVFNAGTADQEGLLTVLELLLNEQPPAPAQTSATGSSESAPSK